MKKISVPNSFWIFLENSPKLGALLPKMVHSAEMKAKIWKSERKSMIRASKSILMPLKPSPIDQESNLQHS